MILPYKQEFPWGEPTNFKEKILSKVKIHSLREDPGNRRHIGQKIHHAYGVRTKKYNCFKIDYIVSIQEIWIEWDRERHGFPFVRIEDRYLYFPEIVLLALNDGFNYIYGFSNWFNEDFSGKIIHWTDFKY